MTTISTIEFWKKEQLDTISPTFCAAKWKQVTIHLQNGHTHSCHHPSTKQVPLAELEGNPSALHNTKHKKQMRQMMLNGQRPDECDYCWKVEDTGMLSDRTFKSYSEWAAPHIPDIVSKPWDDNAVPSYLEVSFGHVCNFKCSYCSPHISSKWMEEIEQYGPYPTLNKYNDISYYSHSGLTPIPNNQDNPYVDAFWEWWPSISNKLEHFRITGGEPLLNKNTYKFLDYLIENPSPNMDVSINANLCPPDDLMDKFIEKVKLVVAGKRVKKFKIFTSAEAYGAQAEYIRHGMDYNKWISNIERLFAEIPGITITIMSTYNALSVTSYKKFLHDVLWLKRNNYDPKHHSGSPIILDIPYLRYPPHQSAFILTGDFADMISEQVSFMRANAEIKGQMLGFNEHEIDKMMRINELFLAHPKELAKSKNNFNRTNFKLFVDEHDRRRGTNFLETFPEMREFYEHCGSINYEG
jgi:organic radical activating enzyme